MFQPELRKPIEQYVKKYIKSKYILKKGVFAILEGVV